MSNKGFKRCKRKGRTEKISTCAGILDSNGLPGIIYNVERRKQQPNHILEVSLLSLVHLFCNIIQL